MVRQQIDSQVTDNNLYQCCGLLKVSQKIERANYFNCDY
jgi:hypothetical protein